MCACGAACSTLAAAGSGRLDAGSDRAAHPGAAQSAIAERVFREGLLMIVLGEVELPRVARFRRDTAHVAFRQGLAVGRLGRLGGGALRRRGDVDAGAVLGPDVVALAHALGRVMAFPKSLQ